MPVSGNRLHIGDFFGNAYALDTATGRQEWIANTDDLINAIPVVTGDTVYPGSADRRVDALDAASGQAGWSHATGDFMGATSVPLSVRRSSTQSGRARPPSCNDSPRRKVRSQASSALPATTGPQHTAGLDPIPAMRRLLPTTAQVRRLRNPHRDPSRVCGLPSAGSGNL
ncbi:PQQ-binding-like beta-propeller repeat protein [Kitasatospora sp. NPDC006697]|uniref:outer membrane protein assembly factor BamB family protein n=1 Tax=Kitasatospora sp. NPDC006697 TaxID=3364020 RepID=UPI0036BB46E0